MAGDALGRAGYGRRLGTKLWLASLTNVPAPHRHVTSKSPTGLSFPELGPFLVAVGPKPACKIAPSEGIDPRFPCLGFPPASGRRPLPGSDGFF
jgi:hypothetical protein